MRGWKHATFIFISTAAALEPGGIEERWFAVMAELKSRGSDVRLLAPLHTDVVERARELGLRVDPYMLGNWNAVRTRSRLRKYLRRYQPTIVHSTGAEADVLLRWAARRVPGMRVVHTLRRECVGGIRRTIAILMRRLANLDLRGAMFVFAETPELVDEAVAAGVPADHVMLDPVAENEASLAESVRRHLDAYWRLMSN